VGLKGRLDFFLRDEDGDALLELKTGQARGDLPKSAHRWQVFGYQTLLSVRRPLDHHNLRATLLYSATAGQAEAYTVPFVLRDLHRVLGLRNLLALAHATGAVPAPPGGAKCSRCSLRPDCSKASMLLGWEAPPDETPTTQQDPDDAAWFTRMYELLRLEQRAAEEQTRTLWRLSPVERMKAGIALGNLTPDGEPHQTANGEWEYSFRCENTSELREGDAVLLSDGDPVGGAIVTGSVLRLDQHGVTIWAPERINCPALIDRYGSDIVHDRTVRNLWRWLDADPHLRGLVAGSIAPTFNTELTPNDLTDLPGSFNQEQRLAVTRALAARDFLLAQGPPGTGKTRVVAEIVRQTLARGERVLLAAFTNQAVDNALHRIVGVGCTNVVRLGHSLSMAPDLRPYSLSAPTSDSSPQRMRERLLHADLVAATTATWSAEHYDEVGEPLCFDLAIIDEATQITTPALLGALRFARRFVLVGDERQLPPLVMSQDAAQGGLKQSLFSELLARWGETASVALRKQYRMRPEICAFPSETFYAGALVAEGAARTATLAIAWKPAMPLALVLDPARPMLFVDTPSDPASQEPARKVSAVQVEAARKIVLALRLAGVSADEIGVIAPYRAQVAAIRQQLAASGETQVVVDTVDRFQGAERDVIIFSFGGLAPGAGVTLPGTHGPDFLADPHRLNVALTRARLKLILIGDKRTLAIHPLLRRLIEHCGDLYEGHGGLITARFTR
ncbi:MAG: AAA domain-containing protein, partial [Ktedonobacterales bacterium]